ncbi:flagellar basal-body rod protein FlgF [Natroniella sp. ANB-PHB2]|uniref:flagellar basal-body rod protein FlgF n=1 Tax=Natroniella sp. ANB-PHB2 TaxID=3384444 RepID=UPI0038D3D521
MLRSMFAGVSGLGAHMDKMDVISNNISNVNTTGFKSSRATFQSMLSQTMEGASAPQDGRGGTNPQQVGLGVSLGSIDKSMEQGSLESTGRNTDLAIEGDGFFVVNDGTSDLYTRAGNTNFDRDGYLVNSSNGYRMQGWMADADENIDSNQPLEDISLRQSMDANATSEITYDGNLSADVPGISDEDDYESADGFNLDNETTRDQILEYLVTDSIPVEDDEEFEADFAQFEESTRYTSIQSYDSQGRTYDVNVAFTRVGEGNGDGGEWEWNIVDIKDELGNVWVQDLDDVEDIDIATALDIDEDNVTQLNIGDGEDEYVDENRVITFDEDGNYDSGNSEIQLDPEGVNPLPIDLNFEDMNQYAGDFSADVDSVNGYQAGDLDSFDIDGSGTITGYYDNGQRQTLAQIATATFNNPSGLSEEGDTTFRESNNSGVANIGAPGAGGRGTISGGTIEMSNVDMSREFTEMITTQRGFQGNSRSITTADELLQEVVNMKR